MSDEYVWSAMRDAMIERTGQTPSAEVESRVLAVFQYHPKLVEASIAHVTERYERGIIRSPWPVLAKHAEEARDALGRGDGVTVSNARDRVKARERGARWIKSTGVHYDRDPEVEDELFGPVGMLRDYADDAELRDELLALWASERPRGVRCEAEAVERGRRQRAHLQQARAAVRTGNPFLA